jgi:diaminopimelate epimerase
MELRFAKMHGAANDFVILEEAPPKPPRDAALVRALCHRRKGIGGDGALFMERLKEKGVGSPVFRMYFYNLDGSYCEMCFNGARCCALRAWRLGWCGERFSFLSEYGSIEAQILQEGARVRLWFAAPKCSSERLELPQGSVARNGHEVNTGDPHLVVEVENGVLDSNEFEALARPLRWWTSRFAEGTNVHFVHRGPHSWRIRSFERGVEGETWACGSGCIASVAALHGLAPKGEPVRLHTRGGDEIQVQPQEEAWMLEGPVVEVFSSRFVWDESVDPG